MKRLLLSLIIVTLTCNIFTQVNAEPANAVKYLINEPVSMLDLALFKMRFNIDSFTNNKFPISFHDVTVVSRYDWETNRITITISIDIEKDKYDVYEIQKSVENHFINRLRASIVVGYPMYFNHEGFQSKSRPDNLIQNLINITDILIDFCDIKDPFNPFLQCKSPLYDKDSVYWKNLVK